MNKSCVCVAANAIARIWAKPAVLGPEKRFSIENSNWQHGTDCLLRLQLWPTLNKTASPEWLE